MAAYIELNPVRAKICDDPKDYRWCSYAEAVAGGKIAQATLCELNAIEPHGGVSEKSTQLPVKEELRRWRWLPFWNSRRGRGSGGGTREGRSR